MHTHYVPIHCAELQEKELLDFNFPALHKEAATHFRFLLVACLRKISEYVRNKNKTSGDINHKALLRAEHLTPIYAQTQAWGLSSCPSHSLSHILVKPVVFFLEEAGFQHADKLQERVCADLTTTRRLICWRSTSAVAQEVPRTTGCPDVPQ